MPLTSPSTDACPLDESSTNTTSYTVKLTDPRAALWLQSAGKRAWIICAVALKTLVDEYRATSKKKTFAFCVS